MFATLNRAARTPDLRRKLAITLGLLLIFRVGSMLPAPGVSHRAVQTCLGADNDAGLVSMINLFSGGALLQLALFSLGVMPYITASIIMQLLTAVVPRLHDLKKDGGAGAAKINQYSRYLTVGLATTQAAGLVYAAAGTPSRLYPDCGLPVLANQSPLTLTMLGVAMVGGAVAVMWLGELITERGIGNGVSLLMMASIAAHLPSQVATLGATQSVVVLIAAGVGALVLVGAVVFIEQAQRQVPVTYSQKSSGGRVLGTTTTYLPLKVNQAGVVPVIFASSLLYMPAIIATFTGENEFSIFVSNYFTRGDHPLYIGIYVVLIFFFAFFYVAMTYNPVELSDNIRNAGGFVPGFRPGEPTTAHLDYVLTRLTVAGAVYLSVLATLPLLLLALTGGANQMPLGGTSLLILVGVGLQTIKQLDAQLMQRHYPGFLSAPVSPAGASSTGSALTTERSIP